MAPVRILTSVLFPAPLAPISAWTSPGRTASDAALSATTAPYVFWTPVASSSRSVAVRVMSPRGCAEGAGDAGALHSGSWEDYSPGPLQATACSGVYVVQPSICRPSGHSGSRPSTFHESSVALPSSVTLSARTGLSRTVFGCEAAASVSTAVPSSSLVARLMPAPPTAAVLVTAAPSRPGDLAVAVSWPTNAPRSAPTIGTGFLFAA